MRVMFKVSSSKRPTFVSRCMDICLGSCSMDDLSQPSFAAAQPLMPVLPWSIRQFWLPCIHLWTILMRDLADEDPGSSSVFSNFTDDWHSEDFLSYFSSMINIFYFPMITMMETLQLSRKGTFDEFMTTCFCQNYGRVGCNWGMYHIPITTPIFLFPSV